MPLLVSHHFLQWIVSSYRERYPFISCKKAQSSALSSLYTLQSHEINSTLLSLPSPTRQKNVSEVEVVPEMEAFLEGLQVKGQHHLLINLQDRSSWKEHARSMCLEKSQKKDVLTVISLDRESSFYEQRRRHKKSLIRGSMMRSPVMIESYVSL